MVARFIFFCLALLLPATIGRAADPSNSPPPAAASKSPADVEGSPEWINHALQQNDSDAVVNLALKYLEGNGVPKDGKQAVRLLVCAVSANNYQARRLMGYAFSKGIGVPRSDAKALDWLEASARDGYAVAQSDLGRNLWAAKSLSDYPKAFDWIARAAAQGFPTGQADLGIMYEEGIGTKPDNIEALKWLQLALDAGFKEAVDRRNEVTSLMDPSQKLEAARRVRAFKPETNQAIIANDALVVSCPMGKYFQIPVSIFGKTNFMVVDTGSSVALLDVDFRDRLGKPLTSEPGYTTSTSRANFTFFDCPEIFIGETRFAPLLAIIEDFKTLRHVAGEPIHGILGASCLKYSAIGFDCDNGIFSVSGSVPEPVKAKALALPLVQTGAFEFAIEASINGRGPVILDIDSGDDMSIDLNDSDWQKVFAGNPPALRSGKSVDAEGKFVENVHARLASLAVGTNLYRNLVADKLVNPNIRSRFGQGFIRRHICWVDFPNRMLYLLPGREFDRPEEYDMSGLRLLDIEGKITAFLVDEDSPAFDAGIRSGDQILSLNDQDTASLHLQSIRGTLKAKPGDEIKMRVRHGEQINLVKFYLKRLL